MALKVRATAILWNRLCRNIHPARAERRTELEQNGQERCEPENTALRDNNRNSTKNVSFPKGKARQEEKIMNQVMVRERTAKFLPRLSFSGKIILGKRKDGSDSL